MQYDVIIVGFGVVGNTAALLLAQQGLKVAVCECLYTSEMRQIVKAGRIDREVLRIFEDLELQEEILNICRPLQGAQLIDNKENILLPIDEQGAEPLDKSKAPMYAFYQPQMQQILQHKAKANPLITLYEGYDVNNIEQVPQEGVIVAAFNKKNNHTLVLKGKYLLVCSGVKTPIAKLCNITPVDYNYKGLTLNIETTTKVKVEKSPFAHTFYHAAMPVTRLLYASHAQRWEVQLPADTPRDKVFSEAEIKALLQPIMKEEFEIKAMSIYEFNSSMLRRWHDDYIVFAGDSAHTMAPYLGLNLSAGIKDVHNVAWKIALLCKDMVGEKIMNAYQIERENSIRYAIRVNAWIGTMAMASRWRLLKFLMPMVPKALFKKRMDFSTKIEQGIVGTGKNKGKFLHNFEVINTQGRKVKLSKILGNQFNILAFDVNPVDASSVKFIEAMAFLKAQFIQIVPSATTFEYDNRYVKYVQDVEGNIQKWLQKENINYLIIRPDGIIFDAVKTYKELNNSLQLLQDKLYLELPNKEVIIKPFDDEDLLAEEDDDNVY